MTGRFGRRELLVAGAAAVACAPFARAAEDNRLTVKGERSQGGFLVGQAGQGSQVWIDSAPVRVGAGAFCFGFAYDAVLPTSIRARLADGSEVIREMTPHHRDFIIQHINGLPEKYVSPPLDILARIKRDAAVVREVRDQDSDHLWFTEPFDWPADGPITGIFGSQRILDGEPRAPHFGVDIAAPEGSPIRAPMPGIVTLAEYLYLSGNTMIIDHGHGVSTTYLHMSRIDAKLGTKLDRGQQMGLIGHTGRATGPHVCWRLNWFQTRLDVALVAPPRPRDRV
jgi:Peptidase family M23